MKTTREMRQLYRENYSIPGQGWKWLQTTFGEYRLIMGGHHIASVKRRGVGWAAYCPADVFAQRASEAAAKKAAEDAVRAWIQTWLERYFVSGEPLEPNSV